MWRWLVLSVLPATLAGAPPTYAVQADGVGLYPAALTQGSPPWFTYHLAPGQERDDAIIVDNRSTQPIEALLYPVDASPNGDNGFGMQPLGSHPHDAGGWVKLSTSRINVAAHSSAKVSFRFNVPRTTSVGPHYGGIIMQPLRASLGYRSGLRVQIISRLGVRIYETVPGQEHPGLQVGQLRHVARPGPLLFAASLTNTGNSLLTPSGQLQVRAFAGPERTTAINLGAALAPSHHTTLTMPTTLHAGWLPNIYRVRMRLTYGHQNPKTVVRLRYVATGSWVGWLLVTTAILLVGSLVVKRPRWLWRRLKPRVS